MAVGSVVMWIGVPLGLIYLASQIADSSRPSRGPYLLVLIGLPIGMAIVGKCLGTSTACTGASPAASTSRRRATWLRSMRARAHRDAPRRRARQGDDRVGRRSRSSLFAVWFFGFAGSSLPDGLRREASGPTRRISRVHVIVLGIDPGVANTGYGIVAHDRGRLVALDGGVIETAAGQDAGARLAEIHAPRRRADGRLPARRGRGRGPLLRRQRPLGVRGRPGARRRHPRRRASATSAATSYTPQQVKAAVCGSGRAGQGAGPAHGPDAARAARAAQARPRRRRARGRDLPRQRRAAGGRAAEGRRHDRARLAARSRSAAAITSSSPAAASATGSRSPPRRCATSRAWANRRRSSAT